MSSKKLTLKSSDGEPFEVDVIVALESQKIKCMIEDDCADGGIPLPNVMSKILAKVIEYCKKHVEAPPKTDDRSADEDLKAWDAEFVKVDQATLYALGVDSSETGLQIFEHQEPTGSYLPESSRHDQGKDPSEDFQDF